MVGLAISRWRPRRRSRPRGGAGAAGYPALAKKIAAGYPAGVGLAISRWRPRRRSRTRGSAGAAGYPAGRRPDRSDGSPSHGLSRGAPRRPDRSDGGRSRALVPRRPDRSDRGRAIRSRASKTCSGQRRKLGRHTFAATEEDGGRARGAGTMCTARRGPARTDRAWRALALVVASFGWRSGRHGQAERGPWGAPSAPRMRVERIAMDAGGDRPRVDEEGSVRSKCDIGPCRPNTSGSTSNL